MSKLKEYKLVIIIFSLFGLILGGSVLLINIALNPYYRPDKEKIEKYFKRDRENISLVTDYFSKYSDSFSFDSASFKSRNYSSLIENSDVVDAIIKLFERGYSAIGKDDNTIYLKKWSRGDGLAIGIAHPINGVDEPQLEYLTRLEPLSENGWYFYEINYNE